MNPLHKLGFEASDDSDAPSAEELIVTSVPIFEAEDVLTSDTETGTDVSSDSASSYSDATNGQRNLTRSIVNRPPHLERVDRKWWGLILEREWVTNDKQYIHDPTSQVYDRMPIGRADKKKAVIELYIFLAKSVYFIHLAFPPNWHLRLIPQDVFGNALMPDEAEDLQKATFDQIHYGVLTRTKTVCEEWRLKYNFAKIPECDREVKLAGLRGKKEERVVAMLMILRDAGAKNTQRWLSYIFQPVQGAVIIEETFGPGDMQERVFAKIVNRVEVLFGEAWTVTKEYKLWAQTNKVFMETVEQLNEIFGSLRINDV